MSDIDKGDTEKGNGFRFSPRKLVSLETLEDYLPSDEEDDARPPAVVCTTGKCLPVYSAEELKQTLDSLMVGSGTEEMDSARKRHI